MRHTRIIRASAGDMVELASDIGPAPRQVGAVLFLAAPGDPLGPKEIRDAVARRLGGIRRLHQRLLRPPWGCGRPVWVDDPDFDIDDHVRTKRCRPPGDRAAVLAAAVEILGRRLPPHRPPWGMTLLHGLDGGGAALVIVMHHVLTDGMGGLAVLARLADGAEPEPQAGSRQQPPSTAELAADAAISRLRALGHIGAAPRTIGAAVAELRSGSAPRAVRCSLNRPVGVRRKIVTASGGLDAVLGFARAHAASVNDVMLAVIAGALDTLLAHRHEHVDPIIVSVPVAARPHAAVALRDAALPHAVPRDAAPVDMAPWGTAPRGSAPMDMASWGTAPMDMASWGTAPLGNKVGVMPVAVPTGLSVEDCLPVIAAATSSRRRQLRGASAALLAPAFRALAAVRLLRWAVNHQRLVHTFLTNLRGPDERVSFLGHAVDEIVPLNVLAGNVAVDFAVFSYAGRISITTTADPDVVPDLDVVADALAQQMRALPTSTPTPSTTAGRPHEARHTPTPVIEVHRVR